MSVSEGPGSTLEAVRQRHRQLVILGVSAALAGIVMAVFIAYEWFVRSTSHEVLAVVAAVTFLVGVQVLVLTSLSSMLITLNRERGGRPDGGTDE